MSGFDIKSILGDGISSRNNINHHSELNIPTLNTENNVIPHDNSSNNLYVRSPYFNIPPGLSPTTLLESPIFLSSSLDQQSPTTGKFEFAPTKNGIQFDNMDSNFFSSRPVIESGHSPFLGASSKITAVHESSFFQSQTGKEPPTILNSRSDHSHYLPTDFHRVSTVNSHVGGTVANSPPLDEEANQTDGGDATRGVDASDDGYNWRKYGQKQVKGSDYPRSYYKCTHPNCTVKKKVERSYEGHITEIIYKGAHNHSKPHPNRGSTLGLIDPRSDNNFQTGVMFDGSSAFSNDDDEDEDESDSKRRKMEKSGGTGAIKKPKVVVQTTSQVDVLDDGYHWRKYGQKVVKGNPNPRSYYKCTSPGCLVRKHVERASHDLNSVITMYEGKHNHDVPAARNNGYSNLGSPTNGAAQVGNTISVSTHLHRPDKSQFMNSLDFGYGMNETGLANLVMARLGPNHGPPIQPCFGEMGFVLPKGEPNLESVSNSPSAHNQIMRNL